MKLYRFSVADIGSFIMLSTAATLGAPLASSCTHLAGWLARVAGRPAVRRELEAMSAYVRALPRAGTSSA